MVNYRPTAADAGEAEGPSMRLFVALLLDPPVLEELVALQKLFAHRLDPELVRWVRVDQLHLTLRFFGDVTGRFMDSLQTTLRAAVAGHPCFTLHLRNTGCFPDPNRPKVFWVGLGGNLDALIRLQKDVEHATGSVGLPPDPRPFLPHLTIGRARRVQASSGGGAELWQEAKPRPLETKVREVHLIQSELGSGGPRYTRIATFPLATTD